MNEQAKAVFRCAVYTRKSHADGLEQSYNSLDAQRDAGHAYVASQSGEGWVAIDSDYDDGGYSGANMERPALQRLLTDIAACKINIVVVYKIDRLTRSLLDFAKMIEIFDAYDVSFVAVSQQINTSNSMGRLMLNVLLSFAQFERELTGERIRDKIAASKRKGLWTGGIPPLGYDLQDKHLLVNEEEAKTVRHLFARYIALQSMTAVAKECRQQNIKGKAWTSHQGVHRAAQCIDAGKLHKLLHNRVYLGELGHKGDWLPGIHQPIIDQDTWDAAHKQLANNEKTRGNHLRAKVPFLLQGMVFSEDGRAMTPWSTAKKNGKRYRYYLNTREIKQYAGASIMARMPAAELETIVVNQARAIFQSPSLIRQVAVNSETLGDPIDEAMATVALTQIDKVWGQLFPAEQSRIIQLLVDKVIVSPDNIDLRLHNNGIEQLTLEMNQNAQVETAI